MPSDQRTDRDVLDRLFDVAADPDAALERDPEVLADVGHEIERLREALKIIAGESPCIDNLLGNADIARIALHGK